MTSIETSPRSQAYSDVVSLLCILFQICSPPEKKAIDKMIDAGPQLAGSMEFNVVLSECLSHVVTTVLAYTRYKDMTNDYI
mgnify:CR=1 FL=1